MMAPPQTTLSVIPASSSAGVPAPPARRATAPTSRSAPAAPSKASNCPEWNGPHAHQQIGHRRAMNAPKLAPPATPSVQGSASGLRNNTCSVAPLMASAPPASKPNNTRGRRSWKKIIWSAVQSPPHANNPRRLKRSGPTHGNSNKHKRLNPPNRMIWLRFMMWPPRREVVRSADAARRPACRHRLHGGGPASAVPRAGRRPRLRHQPAAPAADKTTPPD